MKLEWSDNYTIGISSIDRQHKVLIELINNLDDALLTKNRDLTSETLMGLLDYTMNHFIFEEEIFERIGYKETPAHKNEHAKFTRKIIGVLDSFDSGKDIDSNIILFLNDWLLHHILKVDKAYVQSFKENNID